MAYCTALIVYLHCILHLLHSPFPYQASADSANEVEVDHQIQKSAQLTPLSTYFLETTMLLPPMTMITAGFWAMLVISVTSVLADTEIRNFHLPLPPLARSIHPTTQILDIPLSTSPQVLNISNIFPEIWIRTSLEQYKSWTARISWPASVCFECNWADIVDTNKIRYGSIT